jgi:predicted nucleic acid-binding protein
MKVYLDSGAFLARYLARDAYHRQALAIWEALRGAPLFTSNDVLDEVWTLLGKTAGHEYRPALPAGRL